jgi:TPR repeat protein
MMKRVEANDSGSMFVLAYHYYNGVEGSPLDQTKAVELFARTGELGCSQAHCYLGSIYRLRGDIKKAKFHFEAAAMAGNEVARNDLGTLDANSGNMEQAIKHWTIAASAGDYKCHDI